MLCVQIAQSIAQFQFLLVRLKDQLEIFNAKVLIDFNSYWCD